VLLSLIALILTEVFPIEGEHFLFWGGGAR
jgi:hypothetical protein